MRNSTSNWNLFYDGNQTSKRFVLDTKEADDWFNSFKSEELVTYKLTHHQRVSNNVIPLIIEWEDVNEQFNKFLIKEQKIQSGVKSLLLEFLKKFDVLRDPKGRIGFRKKMIDRSLVGDSGIPDGGLMRMKEFMFGIYRFEPLRMLTGEKKDGQISFIEHEIHNNFGLDDPIRYTYNGEPYTTPLYGIYAPQYRHMMFGDLIDFGGGRNMQKRQLQASYLLGEQTYIAAPRGSGKSFLVSSLASIFASKALVNPAKLAEGMLINIYGLTKTNNEQIVQKILNLNKKMGKGKLFKYVGGNDSKILFFDGESEPATIKFYSQWQNEPGRWSRPSLIIVDEAARMDESILEIIKGESSVPKIYISTIDHTTKKQRFYNDLVRAEFEQNLYPETMDELVVRLWKKYGLDNITCMEEIASEKRLLNQLQQEFFENRPLVWLRYTLDDNELKTAKEKEGVIKDCSQISMNYLLAEQYSQFMDEDTLFDYDGLMIEKLPDEYDYITMFLDQATTYDNPALSICGVRNDTVYVLESVILPKEEKAQFVALLDYESKYKRKYKNVYRGADCTQAKIEQRAFLEDRWFFLDMALYITGGGNEKSDTQWFRVVGKDLLIQVAQKFFQRKNVLFINTLEQTDKTIFDELNFFQADQNANTKRISYKAIKGKDDQVMALLGNLYFIYNESMKDELSKRDVEDVNVYSVYADIDGMYDERRFLEQENKKMEWYVEEMFGKFGF